MNTEQILDLYYDDRNNRINLRELSHRFRETYCALWNEQEKVWEPKKIYSFDFDDSGEREKENLKVRLLHMNRDNSDCGWYNIIENVRLEIPKMGLFSWKGSVLFSSIYANRNWRRGLQYQSISYHDPLSLDSYLIKMNKNFKNMIQIEELLKSLYNNKMYSITEAIDKIQNNIGRAFPISSSFFLCITSESEDIMIGYKRWIIGRIEIDLLGNYSYNLFKNDQLKEEIDPLFKKERT